MFHYIIILALSLVGLLCPRFGGCQTILGGKPLVRNAQTTTTIPLIREALELTTETKSMRAGVIDKDTAAGRLMSSAMREIDFSKARENQMLNLRVAIHEGSNMILGKFPDSIQEAWSLFRERTHFAIPPTKAFKYKDAFYFSGGTGTDIVEDFSTGFLLRRGDPYFYAYYELDGQEAAKEHLKAQPPSEKVGIVK